MISEAFFMCAMALPPSFHTGHHRLVPGDTQFLHVLTERWRQTTHQQRPPILFVYNYFDLANQLRKYGIRAYSMTISLSGGHFKGLLEDLAIQDQTLAAIILMQHIGQTELFEACESVAYEGILMIEKRNLPYNGEAILKHMGFSKMFIQWHDHIIYRRNRIRLITSA